MVGKKVRHKRGGGAININERSAGTAIYTGHAGQGRGRMGGHSAATKFYRYKGVSLVAWH